MGDYFFEWSTWVRGFFMMVYILLYGIVRFVVLGVAFFQFGSVLLTGKPNMRLLSFGESLSIYTYQVVSYLTWASDDMPFPMGEWPSDVERIVIDNDDIDEQR